MSVDAPNSTTIARHLERSAHHVAANRTAGFANRLIISNTTSTCAAASADAGLNINTLGCVAAYATVGQCVSEYALKPIKIANTNPPIVHRPQNPSPSSGTATSTRASVVVGVILVDGDATP